MTLILLQAIIQSISSTLYWIGLYVGIRALPGDSSRRLRWTVGSAAVLAAWLVGMMLLRQTASSAATPRAYPLRS